MKAPVLFDVTDHIATLTLNRPQVRNAMDIDSYRQLSDSIRRASADPSVSCLIITGTDPAFCAGDDIKILSGEDQPKDSQGQPMKLELPGGALRRCSKPIIAAINGPALGYGLEMAVLSDFRLASERATFSALYIRRSLVAPADSWERLPGIVGPEAAAELLLTGDTIDAERALALRLVSRLVPHDELMPAARELGARLARNPPLALEACKQAMALARTGDRKELRKHINASVASLSGTDDYRESIQAFRERRDPIFRGC